MVTSECILVTHSLPDLDLAAGTYLDPGDPQLAALPPWAQHNQCSISPILAVLFFSSFTILCTMFTMSLVVGVIIDNFEKTFSDDEKPMSGSITQFAAIWAEFDPLATHFMPVQSLLLLLARLDAPLGCRGAANQGRALLKLLEDAPIPVHHPGERVRGWLPPCAWLCCCLPGLPACLPAHGLLQAAQGPPPAGTAFPKARPVACRPLCWAALLHGSKHCPPPQSLDARPAPPLLASPAPLHPTPPTAKRLSEAHFPTWPQVHFLEVLFSLVRRVSSTQLPMDAEMAAQEELMRRLPVLQGEASVHCNAMHWYAAAQVQVATRRFLALRRLRRQQQQQQQQQQGGEQQ
jgi:hypothetical protein